MSGFGPPRGHPMHPEMIAAHGMPQGTVHVPTDYEPDPARTRALAAWGELPPITHDDIVAFLQSTANLTGDYSFKTLNGRRVVALTHARLFQALVSVSAPLRRARTSQGKVMSRTVEVWLVGDMTTPVWQYGEEVNQHMYVVMLGTGELAGAHLYKGRLTLTDVKARWDGSPEALTRLREYLSPDAL